MEYRGQNSNPYQVSTTICSSIRLGNPLNEAVMGDEFLTAVLVACALLG